MATELAKAYVQIIPSAQGMKKALEDILGDNMPSGKEPGKKIGSGIVGGIGGVIKGGAGVIGSAVSSVAKASAAAATATVTAAAGSIVALTKQAISAYADYEQLVGGVETLFKNSSDIVMKYAESAYKTAGLSANDYMETVTSFSASLLQGLGGDTEKAAEIADQAITDMSDNANKMGTSMEAIQNAYQGFAKQNYTMLDNLKLGYGGTASEMARLINDSGVLGDITVDAETLNKTVSFDQMIEAIHVIQGEMGITGTTAKEASSTISGSLQMVKSSWTNLVAGLGNKDANVGELVKQFTESVKTFGSNVLPIAKEALLGIGTLIKELVPEIVSAIPEIAQEVIPELAETISTLTPEIISAFEQIITSLVEQMPVLLPILLEGAIQLFMGIISALDKVTDVLIPMLPELISQITSALKSTIPQLISAGFDLLMGLVMGIADNAEEIVDAILDLIPQIIDTITDNLPQILEAGGKILYAIVTGIGDHLPEITQSVVKLVAVLLEEIVLHLPDILAAGADMLGSLAMGIVSTFEPLSDALSDLMLEFTDWASDLWDSALEWGGDLIDNFVEGIKNAAGAVWDTLEDIGEGIADLIGFSEPEKGPLSNFHTYAPDMMKLFSEGIDDNSYLIEDSMNKAMSGLSMSSQQLPTTTAKGLATASVMASGQKVITLRLTDAAGRVIAESTAPYIDIIQGESMMLAEMGIA